MTITLVFLMSASILAAYGVLQGKEGVWWGRPLAVVMGLSALAVLLLYMLLGGRTRDAVKFRAIEDQYQRIAGEKMGGYLADNFPGQVILIVGGFDYSFVSSEFGSKFTPRSQAWRNYLVGIQNGVRNSMHIAGIVEMPISEETRKMIEHLREHSNNAPTSMLDVYFMEIEQMQPTSDSFNAAIRPYIHHVDIIIALSELPHDVENLDLWYLRDPPKLALITSRIPSRIKDLMNQEHVIAVIANRPAYELDKQPVPKGVADAFNRRYLLITPDNLENMASAYDNLFIE